MKSCNRVIVLVLLLLTGCGAETPDLTTATIQDVGLVATSGTPPLGEGVAPIAGTGGDGAPSVAGKGIAEGGPGAVRWYGGQWLIPWSGRPGSAVQNVSCDVLTNGQSTDLIELVGAAGVIGSVQSQALNGAFRLWITHDTPGAQLPYTLGDGEALTFRHSPRGVATGAYTSGVEQMTITGCAVNATPPPTTDVYSIDFAIPAPGTGLFPGAAGISPSLALNTSTASSNLPLRLPSGRMLTSWLVRIIRNSSSGAIAMRLWRTEPGSSGAIQIGNTQFDSGPPGTARVIGQIGLSETIASASYFIEVQGGGSSGDMVMDYQDSYQ